MTNWKRTASTNTASVTKRIVIAAETSLCPSSIWTVLVNIIILRHIAQTLD